MSRVVLSGVEKWFDDTQVLFNVNFAAEAGEFVVILGPSGCGKSTCLRLLAGLETAQKGEIRINGALANAIPPSERGLAMVFQNYALFPHLSVRENILFGLRVRRVKRAERMTRLTRAAELLGLTEYLERKPAQLSGGQRQRVALGRALVSGASVVLMDEPLSNLDAKLRQQMRMELRQLQRTLGLTVIYVTHDQVEAMTMADKVVVMRDGQVDQIASPRELYRRPSHVEVARFVGAPPMVLFGARQSGLEAEIKGAGVSIGLDAPECLDRELMLGIRPEDIHVQPQAGDIPLAARVRTVELLGADVLVKLDAGATDSLVARWHSFVDVTEGQDITVGLPVGRLHIFDARTGRRIEEVSAIGALSCREKPKAVSAAAMP